VGKICPICGEENLDDPENPEHVMSKQHQSALEAAPALKRLYTAIRRRKPKTEPLPSTGMLHPSMTSMEPVQVLEHHPSTTSMESVQVLEHHQPPVVDQEDQLPDPISSGSSTVLMEIVETRFRSLENGQENLNVKIDSILKNMDQIQEKLNNLPVTTVSSKEYNVLSSDYLNAVINNVNYISDIEVMAVLGSHTIGVVISFFEQEHGPVPIIVTPENLRENLSKLISLSDLSFSNCQIEDDFESETTATFDFSLGEGLLMSCICFGFSLNRPQARGGAENITVNILVNKGAFRLVSQFIEYLKEKVHEIHVLMDKHPDEKNKVMQLTTDLRKQISYIVLSYNRMHDKENVNR
jgi:hypothetical protein